MAEEKNKPKSAPDAQPSDPVERTLQELQKETVPHDQVLGMLDQLNVEVRDSKLKFSKEKLTQLRTEATQEVKRDIELHGVEEAFQELTLRDLDVRLAAIEQAATAKPSALPEWAKPMVAGANAMFEPVYEKFKGALASIGSFFGVTVPDKASDALAFVRPRGKKFMLATMASTLGWVPGVADWAKQQIDVGDAWDAIQLATKEVKSSVTLDDLKNEAKWLSLQTSIAAFPGRNIREKTIQYVNLFVSQQRKAAPKAPIMVSMNVLIDAQLTPNFAVKPAPAVPTAVPSITLTPTTPSLPA
jgi:hypothetical protein